MSFIDKVKKAFGSKKEDVESQNSDENSANSEMNDNPEPIESLDNEDIQSNDSEEPPENEEMIDKPTPNEKVRTFRYLDDLIHSGAKEIALDSDIVLGNGEESEYNDGIELDVDNLVIDGNGYAIDAQGKTRIFYCTGKNITIRNATLKNGFTNKDGGAIYNDGELNITESVLNGNSSPKTFGKGGAIYNNGVCLIRSSKVEDSTSESWGGAIYNNGGECGITDSVLANNRGDFGGLIYNNGGKCSIAHCTLSNNVSGNRGGAIYNDHDCICSMTDCALDNNISDAFGGAIHNNGKSTITGCELVNNTAKADGGAIYNEYGQECIICNSKLENNLVQGEYDSKGGAIYNNEGECRITSSTFAMNSAHFNGGAIYNNGGEFSICGSKLVKNNSGKDGGAIYNNEKECSITDSQLENNIAQGEGGAIYNNKGECRITKSVLGDNASESYAGAIYNDGRCTITDSVLGDNSSESHAGAIYNAGECSITGGALTNNSARRDGGAVYNEYRHECSIIGSKLENNISEEGDGGAILNLGNFKIFDCEILRNASSNNTVMTRDSLQIYNTNFRNNQSNNIISNEGDGSNLSISYGEFIDNDVGQRVLFNGGKFCSIEKAIFENNISDSTMNIANDSELILISPIIKDKGKTILNQDYILIREPTPEIEDMICGSGTVEITDALIPLENKFDFGYLNERIHESDTKEIILDHDITFENYERDFYEGGIELNIDDMIIDGNGHTIDGADKSRIFIITGKNITLKNITFKNGYSHRNYDNARNNNGGALKINYDADLTVENCNFISNESEDCGGAISNSGLLEMKECSLSDNASISGCIYNSGKLNVCNSSSSDNISKYGGAIYNESNGKIEIMGCKFIKNTGNSNGGAIYNKGSLNLCDSELSGNLSNWHGGATFNVEGNMTMRNSRLCSNRSGNSGGAICNWAEETILKVESCRFDSNVSNTKGGAIYNSYAHLNVNDSFFKENVSTHEGGAIYCIEMNWFIQHCQFLNNMSEAHGGAIHQHCETYPKFDLERKLSTCTFNEQFIDGISESWEAGL